MALRHRCYGVRRTFISMNDLVKNNSFNIQNGKTGNFN